MKAIAALLLLLTYFAPSPANGDDQRSIQALQQTLRNHPAPDVEGQTRLDLLKIYQKHQNWAEAAKQLARLRQLAPQEPEYAYQLGIVYQKMSKAAFERMKEVDINSARVQQTLGEQYGIAGDQEKAVAAFRKAIAADPKLSGSHLAIAMIYAAQGNAEEARAEINRELEIAPESKLAKQALTMVVK